MVNCSTKPYLNEVYKVEKDIKFYCVIKLFFIGRIREFAELSTW